MSMEWIEKNLDLINKKLIYPDIKTISSAAGPVVKIDGKEVLMFSTNSYLGLTTHPDVKRAAIEAIEKYGTGAGGSRILSGNFAVHQQLEDKLAELKSTESALVYPSGYSTNIGAIHALTHSFGFELIKKKFIILSDKLNHASIIDGCKMGNSVKVVVYNHNDADDLESKLKKYKSNRKLVITDSLFSMNGDIAPLDKIYPLTKKYNSLLMIDEAHSTATLGRNGRGALEHFDMQNVANKIIIMGTLSKALAGQGGFIAGKKSLIDYLRVASRSYMFSTALTPAAAASVIAAINVVLKDNHLINKLHENTIYIKEKLTNLGFDILGSQSQIVPILIGDEEKAIETSKKLFEKGIFAPCARWPAVEKGKARIRITIMALHTKEQIDFFIEAFNKIIREN